jgi:hypothetical protein
MKRLAIALAIACATIAFAASAQADPAEYGIKAASASTSSAQAGGHPDFTTSFELKTEGEAGKQLPSTTKSTTFELPPGLLGNPGAVPKCSAAQLVGTDPEDPSNEAGCPQAAQVGVTEVSLFKNGNPAGFTEPIFNMEPRYGEPARFGFIADVYPVFVDVGLRQGPGEDYGATATVEGVSSLIPLLSADTTIWGTPAEESHDEQRLTPYEAVHAGHPETPTGKRSAGLVPVPFMLNPTRCGAAQGVGIAAVPYALPELEAKAFAPLAPNTGCDTLEFTPDLAIAPTTGAAETGSGLDVNLDFPTDGLEHPNLLGSDDQKRVEVTLPQGVSVNPSEAAGGLGVCSEANFEAETASSLPNEGCPETSKIGTVSATSPLVKETAEGGLFLAKPYDNPFGSLLAIYMVLKIPARGVIVGLAGKVTSDPKTGQLTTTFGEAGQEIPQLPVSNFHLHFREGARAPLVTPDRCGKYESTATFTSWGGQTVVTHPSFKITSGVNGGPCSTGGMPPFKPGLKAFPTNLSAGAYSPFYLRLSREDGEQEITHFSIKLPPGVIGKLAGIPYCSDAQIAAATAREGQPHGGAEELEHSSCPAASEVGHTLAGAGVGSVLAYAPGKMYLAGPYHGSNISLVSITAAKVGPFDLGTVVVRFALRINPETAEVFVDAQGSDPIPHIIAGIPVHLRDIRGYVDKPEFVLNPTSCARKSTASTVLGSGLDFGSESDDQPITVTSPFQVADCASLGFAPKLALSLKGGTKRGDTPAFKAVLTYPKGSYANIAKSVVTLPHSEFLEQAHIGTVCTRAQFKEGKVPGEKCPPASIYGKAEATTPLLSEPLKGSVYLRSSTHNLPDLVAALHNNQVDFALDGRIDSVKGGRIRNTFETVPDAPVSKFVLEMQGGKKGLLVNSTNLCRGTNKAISEFTGQNGKAYDTKPVLQAKCGGKGKKKARGKK